MDIRESIRNHVGVSFKLANHVFYTVSRDDSNLVFSPLSINVLLSLIAAGSKGPTLDQLLDFLNSRSSEDLNAFSSQVVSAIFADGSAAGGPRFSVANGAWIDQTLHLNASFKRVAETVYKTVSESVDFQKEPNEAANRVNLWVEKETGGLINKILPVGAVDSSTRLILANALYFKGNWADKFNPSETKDNKFHLLNGSSIQVPFMSSKKNQCVKAFEGFKALRLPYEQGEDKRRFSMYIFLPDAKDGLPPLMHKISSESGLLDHCLPYHPINVGEFRIPKFKLAFGFETSNVLKELGVVAPFARGGLREMVDSPAVGRDLHVSQIFHKSFIEVNEEGTEAAAATVPTMMGCGGFVVEKKVNFIADHPFLFFIREDLTGVIVFVGTVINPLSG